MVEQGGHREERPLGQWRDLGPHVPGLPRAVPSLAMPSLDWQARLIGLFLALAATKVVGQQGTESAQAPRATLHLSVPVGHWAHAYQAGELAGGEALPPSPSSQPALQGEVDLGVLCSLRPLPGAPLEAECQGL